MPMAIRFVILPAIQAYHAITPLQPEELQALWPLIVARAAMLVLSSEQQQRLDPDNAYMQENAERVGNLPCGDFGAF